MQFTILGQNEEYFVKTEYSVILVQILIECILFCLYLIGFGYKSTTCNVKAKMDYLDTSKCIFFCKKKRMATSAGPILAETEKP